MNGIYDIPADTRSVTFKGVLAKYRWQFEVFALNGATDLPTSTTIAVPLDPGETEADADPGLARDSDKALATTKAAMKAMAPPNLTAELARDTNVSGVGSRGVLVLWNAPADPAGAPVLSYRIDRKIMGEDDDFVTRHDNLDADVTHWVDSSEPPAGEIRYYRVTVHQLGGRRHGNGDDHHPAGYAHDAHDAARGGRADCAEHHRRDAWNRNDNGRVDAGRER